MQDAECHLLPQRGKQAANPGGSSVRFCFRGNGNKQQAREPVWQMVAETLIAGATNVERMLMASHAMRKLCVSARSRGAP